jgi:chromosome segregation ATPase
MSTIPKDIMDKIEEAVNIYTVGNHVSAGLAENILLKGYALAVNKRTEDINEFYKNWCKDTKRNGGILIGSSIKELLTAFGYQLATDGREELEKELEQKTKESKQWCDKAMEAARDRLSLQSQCTEKEKECEELKEALENSRHCRIIADKENDELKQGIKNAIDVKDEYKDMYYNAAKIIEELKAEILELRDSKLKDVKEINSLEAENERLKGLIEMYQQENIR